MIRRSRTIPLYLFCSLVLAQGCAVEAGNPDDEENEGEKGMVKLSISSNETVEGSGLYLNLSSIELAGFQGEKELAEVLAPASEALNLLEKTEDGLLTLTDSAAIAAGVYDSVSVVLREGAPVTYVDANAKQSEVDLDSGEARAIRLEESFEVQAGETTEIVIRFDPGFGKGEGDRFFVKPRAGLLPKPQGVSYEGRLERLDAIVVCAYAYMRPPLPPLPKPRQGPPPRRGPRPDAVEALPPPFFDSAETLTKDEDSACANAVAKTRPAADGSFVFSFLLPATYDFRAFYPDGAFADVEQGVLPTPPKPLRMDAKPRRR